MVTKLKVNENSFTNGFKIGNKQAYVLNRREITNNGEDDANGFSNMGSTLDMPSVLLSRAEKETTRNRSEI